MPDIQRGAPERVRLTLTYEMAVLPEVITQNIRAALQRKYKPFTLLLAPPHEREVSVVGFGPSLRRMYDHLRGDIWACNGAHNWLIERGIIPKYAMFWDASPEIAKFVKPHKDVIYLIASRCHPAVFEALEGFNVYVWHVGGDDALEDLLEEFRIFEPILPGGSAAVTRGMVVATTMGYKKINLFGCDCSFDGETTHVIKSIVDEKKLTVWCDGVDYQSTAWLAGQVEDFKVLAPILRDQGCDLQIYGDGLLPHVARINGFAVHNSTVEEING